MSTVDFKNQLSDFRDRQASQLQAQTAGELKASLRYFPPRRYLAEAFWFGGVYLPVFLFPRIEGRHLQAIVRTEVGDGQAASRLLGKEVPDGFGGMAHDGGFVWGKTRALFWSGQDGVARMLTLR